MTGLLLTDDTRTLVAFMTALWTCKETARTLATPGVALGHGLVAATTRRVLVLLFLLAAVLAALLAQHIVPEGADFTARGVLAALVTLAILGLVLLFLLLLLIICVTHTFTAVIAMIYTIAAHVLFLLLNLVEAVLADIGIDTFHPRQASLELHILLQRIAVGAKRRRHFIAELENRGDDITTVTAVNFVLPRRTKSLTRFKIPLTIIYPKRNLHRRVASAILSCCLTCELVIKIPLCSRDARTKEVFIRGELINRKPHVLFELLVRPDN
jgi:hypothetical protein